MNILVVGSGAREHTLVWKIAQSPLVNNLYFAPGNPGAKRLAENVPIAAGAVNELVKWVEANRIDLTVIGPEAPLVSGIVDVFQERGLPAFGPSKSASMIEGSKVWAKELMWKYGIPTARGAVFTDYREASRYLAKQVAPVVVKADGLAAGKGVIVAGSQDEALQALRQIMQERVFGAAGNRVIIEECLQGKEVSLIGLSDGHTVRPLAPACDYKRIYDGDEGPNTGGMGAYSPPGFFPPDMVMAITTSVLQATVDAMRAEGIVFRGVLYAGLMLTADGPKVLEFNARLGDPETQVILPRLKSDLVPLALASLDSTLERQKLEWHNQVCCGVVVASGGYPGPYSIGKAINGLDVLDPDALVFHAGTAEKDGHLVTAGGRVLTVAALGSSMADARAKVYANVSKIDFEGAFYRKDIAEREVI
jgi:phosphoribosylamine--glycine ligase